MKMCTSVLYIIELLFEWFVMLFHVISASHFLMVDVENNNN